MNTIQFLSTARRILTLYSEGTQKLIFDQMVIRAADKRPDGYVAEIISAVNDLAKQVDKLKESPHALEILHAFNMDSLVSDDFPVQLAERLLKGESAAAEAYHLMREVSGGWYLLKGAVTPLETLLVPAEVTAEQPFDEILTLEIRLPDDRTPTVETIASVYSSADNLYKTVVEAMKEDASLPLRAIYTTSGSTVRVDLKGLGAPVRQIKELLLEGWSKIRHRHADDFRANTKAILEGLHVVDSLASNKHLDPESKARIRHRIVNSMLNLFKASALPREVQPVEVIFNDTLMEGVQIRLLHNKTAPVVAAPAIIELPPMLTEAPPTPLAGSSKRSKTAKRQRKKGRSTSKSMPPYPEQHS